MVEGEVHSLCKRLICKGKAKKTNIKGIGDKRSYKKHATIMGQMNGFQVGARGEK